MYLINDSFNPGPARYLHLDINSCFATVEALYHPHLRGKPLAVIARDTPTGCVLAASYPAKAYGVKTGMRRFEAQKLCPGLLFTTPHPEKYRYVHRQLKAMLKPTTHLITPKSIDEFVLDLDYNLSLNQDPLTLAQNIKQKVRDTFGPSFTVSIGLGPSPFIAKTAASFQKPDGLTLMTGDSFLDIYSKMELSDLCGIGRRLAPRLNAHGIFTTLDFYAASLDKLRSVFASVHAYYWYLNLRGWPLITPPSAQKSLGHSYVLPSAQTLPSVIPTISQLLEKTCQRLRQESLQTKGFALFLNYKDHPPFYHHLSFQEPVYDHLSLWPALNHLLRKAPIIPLVRQVALTCFSLSPISQHQLSLFNQDKRLDSLVSALDTVNQHFGDFTLTSAITKVSPDNVPDSIGFGRIRELD